jgi:hypothetical protein
MSRLVDVAAQRLITRADPGYGGAPGSAPLLPIAALDCVRERASVILEPVVGVEERQMAVIRGAAVPDAPGLCFRAAQWGHWDLLLQARAAGQEWSARTAAGAAWGGHTGLLRRLVAAGCPWDTQVREEPLHICVSSFLACTVCVCVCVRAQVVYLACLYVHPDTAIWALEAGAPVHEDWLDSVAACGCVPVLQWALRRGRLNLADAAPSMVELAREYGKAHVVEWITQQLQRLEGRGHSIERY